MQYSFLSSCPNNSQTLLAYSNNSLLTSAHINQISCFRPPDFNFLSFFAPIYHHSCFPPFDNLFLPTLPSPPLHIPPTQKKMESKSEEKYDDYDDYDEKASLDSDEEAAMVEREFKALMNDNQEGEIEVANDPKGK